MNEHLCEAGYYAAPMFQGQFCAVLNSHGIGGVEIAGYAIIAIGIVLGGIGIWCYSKAISFCGDGDWKWLTGAFIFGYAIAPLVCVIGLDWLIAF